MPTQRVRGLSYSSIRSTSCPKGPVAATSSTKSANCSRSSTPSRRGTPRRSDSRRNVTATASCTSSTVAPEHILMSRRMTGYLTDQSHGSPSMARPSNRSCLPSKSFWVVEISSDLPKRRGRERKNWKPMEPSTSEYSLSVLSMYVKPIARTRSKSYVSVAIRSSPITSSGIPPNRIQPCTSLKDTMNEGGELTGATLG